MNVYSFDDDSTAIYADTKALGSRILSVIFKDLCEIPELKERFQNALEAQMVHIWALEPGQSHVVTLHEDLRETTKPYVMEKLREDYMKYGYSEGETEEDIRRELEMEFAEDKVQEPYIVRCYLLV